ncbi:hypothetical protein LTR78_002241 [Recurvomyces mirabilis]|uniref:SMP domain-containing protein n=1 Tax=Recurvomyces mirabilis TaxID=574656 RepID=A0AAE0WU04_9PEZI|nr:hypothetical protein LTR78_002241 [Recurvomyces mirabilis]KAK5160696.1 hypothetical protein LTS14_001709 [Recurvomyces mirabilis]
MSGNKMTQNDAARIQSAKAKSGNDAGFVSRAQSAGDRNANAGAGSNQQGGKSGGSSNSNSSNSNSSKK